MSGIPSIGLIAGVAGPVSQPLPAPPPKEIEPAQGGSFESGDQPLSFNSTNAVLQLVNASAEDFARVLGGGPAVSPVPASERRVDTYA